MTKHTKKIAFQGFEGAYSDMAARAVFPAADTLPCPSFEDAFLAVENHDADYAVIPVDNTLAGRVADVHHLLPDSSLKIIAEHFLPIRHALLGISGADIGDLTGVHSHVHAIPQCRKIIRALGLKAHIKADTAGAASFVAQSGDKTQAAIASPLAADLYGLEILREDIQDEDHNTTRFLIFTRAENVCEESLDMPENEARFITSLFFRVRNIPAALYKAMGGFATNGLSMAKLESYVAADFQVAQFYAEIEGHVDSQSMTLAMEELGFFAEELRVLGCYPMHGFRFKNG